MKNFIKEQSYKYMSTICQLIGIACCSAFASKMHVAVTCGDLSKLNICSFGFIDSCVALLIGVILLTSGWYIMYLVDKDKAKLGD